MRITQPFVGNWMKTNSLDPPPTTISYSEHQAKLLGRAIQSLFFFNCDILNVNPIMVTWDHFSSGHTTFFSVFFLFHMEKAETTKIPTAHGGELTPFDDMEFLYLFFSITDQGIQKRTQIWERCFLFFPLLLHRRFLFYFLTHLPDLVCCGPDGLSIA
jgi:hypothetical protein